MKFRLLSGIHQQDGKTYKAKDPKCNVVESDIDLVAKHGAERWQKIGGGAEQFEEIPGDDDEPNPAEETADLEAMTVEQLRKYAHDSGVDITGLSRKADIIAAIQADKSGE